MLPFIAADWKQCGVKSRKIRELGATVISMVAAMLAGHRYEEKLELGSTSV